VPELPPPPVVNPLDVLPLVVSELPLAVEPDEPPTPEPVEPETSLEPTEDG
jgi:hypothetical protein